MTADRSQAVLVIEDDASLNRLLVDQIAEMGYAARGARSRAEARALIETAAPDLLVVDIRLPDGDGFDILEEFAGQCPVIVLTAYGTVDQAVKAVRGGASDYLLKPVTFEALEIAVRRAFTTVELHRDIRFWKAQARHGEAEIVGISPEIAEMRALIDLYSTADSTVLVQGESGVGKELVARTIHDKSARREARFVPVDCDAPQENLLASELFGHEQGAFHGAEMRREGMLEIANRGTIYLNDIAEISPALQSKILRVMESGVFRRLGGMQDLRTDVRIIAATSRDLQGMVAQGRFRSELYYRLSAFSVEVPPLRDRRGDTACLAEHFLSAREFQRGTPKEFAPETLAALSAYSWPGNVRELRNAIERGLIMSGSARVILPRHVGVGGRSRRGGAEEGVALHYPDEPTLDRIRRDYLVMLLDRHDGNRQKVASILGISERSTYRLISRLSEPEGTGEED